MQTPKSPDYLPTVRSAHELAEVLKRRRPRFMPEIDQLQNIVTRTHQKLDFATLRCETNTALCELEAAYQALKYLRRFPPDNFNE